MTFITNVNFRCVSFCKPCLRLPNTAVPFLVSEDLCCAKHRFVVYDTEVAGTHSSCVCSVETWRSGGVEIHLMIQTSDVKYACDNPPHIEERTAAHLTDQFVKKWVHSITAEP